MSRVGNSPIEIPEGVELKLGENNMIQVKGPKGELVQKIDSELKLKLDDGVLTIERPTEQKRHKSLHGLSRALIYNMVEGVKEGYKRELELHGVGFRASSQGQKLELSVGYSHPIVVILPNDIKVATEAVKGQPPTVILESHDKQLLGMAVSKIRSLRKPEPYKGKGIRIKGEYVRRKAGKSAAAG